MSTKKRILKLEPTHSVENEVKRTIPIAKHEARTRTDQETVMAVLSWIAKQLANVTAETNFSNLHQASTIEIRFIDGDPGDYNGVTLDSQRRSLEQILESDDEFKR